MVNITPQWDLVVAQSINFLILLFLFNKFLGNYLTNVLRERKALIAKAENVEDEYAAIMSKAEKEKKEIIDEGLRHKQSLVLEAEQVAEQKADRIVANAENDAIKLKHDAEEKVKLLERELKENYVEGVKTTSRLVVEKLFKKDQKLQDAYLDELVEEFSK